jgi:hypothetical protein
MTALVGRALGGELAVHCSKFGGTGGATMTLQSKP